MCCVRPPGEFVKSPLGDLQCCHFAKLAADSFESGSNRTTSKRKENAAMSIYSFHVSNISRGKMQSAIAHYAYISGEEVQNDKTGETLKYKRQDKVLAKNNILPDDAPARFRENAANWINDLEDFEKADNARVGKKFCVALPKEFDLEMQQLVVEQWIKANLTKDGYAATYAIHSSKDGNNPHAHILAANRQLKNGKWQKAKSKTDFERDRDGNKIPLLDENGKQKVRIRAGKGTEKLWKRSRVEYNLLDRKETLNDLRKSWADTCNLYLDFNNQIDHRSYKDRGIMKAPTRHEGYAARAIEKAGGVSWKCEHNRQMNELNRDYQQSQKDGYNLNNQLGGVRTGLDMARQDKNKAAVTREEVRANRKALIKKGEEKEKEEIANFVQSVRKLDPVGMTIGMMKLMSKDTKLEKLKEIEYQESLKESAAAQLLPDIGEKLVEKQEKKKEKVKGKGKGKDNSAPVRTRGGR